MKLFRLRRHENSKNWEFSNVETIPTTLDAWTSNKVQKLKISKANRYKKIAFGILIASAIFVVAYIFSNTYNMGLDPIRIYQNYTAYIACLYISIIIIYICATTHSRFSTTIMVILLLVNFFWLTSFFTQKFLGINTVEFYALAILFLLALAIMHIKYRIRYILIIMIGIPFVIILLNHALPLYTEAPDFQGFYNTQTPTLSIQTRDDTKTLQKAETKITVRIDNTEREILPGESYEPVEIWESEAQIIFSSKTWTQNTYAHLIFPKGAIVTLYPQSAIEINKSTTIPLEKGGSQSGGDLWIFLNIIQWKINTYTPQDQSWYLTLTGDLTRMTLNETGNTQGFIDAYTTKRNAYFINQIGGEIMLNHSIDGFIWRYISFANAATKLAQQASIYLPINLSISWFDQNKLNYDEFHTYLNYQTSTIYETATGSTQRIARDTEKWRNASNVKARRDIIKNIVTTRISPK